MGVKGKTAIFHVHMDAVFASVEQRDTPSFRGRPVVVGARPGRRGVVSAASYEARKYGIHSAMPINEAYSRCPHAVFVRPRMHVYAGISDAIMETLESFSPCIEQISVDEAFMDMSGTEKLWGTPREAAKKIKNEIAARFSLTASIGCAPNKFLAKLASDFNKPDGVTITPSEHDSIVKWLAPLEVNRIWGVGKKTGAVLTGMGIHKIGDLQALSLTQLERRFGATGEHLYRLCRGMDSREVGDFESAKSISNERTYNEDCSDIDTVKKTMLKLSHTVARRARSHGVKGDTVVLTWRLSNFTRHSKRRRLSFPTDIGKTIYDTGISLLGESGIAGRKIRLIGIGITGLNREIQLDIFALFRDTGQQKRSEKTVDTIKEKFGPGVIFYGGEG
jgi:nucleotidyltransferase/DNA polymerase involved in DNA repair